MRIKPLIFWILFVVVAATVIGWKLWRMPAGPDSVPITEVTGPAVILFRGDNSPGCRAIDQLVDEAASREVGAIKFVRRDWSGDNPLIKKYRIRFLPTVVFIDKSGREIARIIGESPAVRQRLEQALKQLDELR